MKNRFAVLALVAILFSLSPFAEASLPVCQLGGPSAMNPNRQLAEGETFVVTDRVLVVNLAFKPTEAFPFRVGECVLPAGSTVAVKNGILMWVKACGNDEVNRSVHVFPTPIADAVRGLDGLPGKDGRNGFDGRDGRDGKDAEVPAKKSHKKAILFAVGGVLGGGVVYALTHKNKHYLNGTTKDVTKCATTSGKFTCK